MKAILIFSAVFLSCFAAVSQSFAPVGSTWYYSNIESFFMPNQGYEKIEAVGDSIMQGKTFRRLSRTYFSSMGGTFALPDEFLFLSGDTVFRLADNDSLYVLYNFGALPGQNWVTRTYDHYLGHDREVTVFVDSISVTSINGEALRQLFVTTNEGMSFGYLGPGIGGKITEKLGGWLYIFPQDYGFWDSDIRIGLRCYSDSVLGNFVSGISPSCTHLITSRENDLANVSLHLYPNPTKAEFTIDLPMQPGRKEIWIYNALGKLVQQQAVSGTETKAHVTLNKSGIYFCQLWMGNTVMMSKKVVVEK